MNDVMTLPQKSMSALEVLGSARTSLDSQLESLLAADREGDCQSFVELAELICENWQLLTDQLAETDNPALMDLIALYSENLDVFLASREHGLGEQGQQLLRRWQLACHEYLCSPAEHDVATRWVLILTDPLWQEPVSEEDALELVEGLTGAIEATQEPVIPVLQSGSATEIDTEKGDALDESAIDPLTEITPQSVDLALVRMIGEEFGKLADDLTVALVGYDCASPEEYRRSLSANDLMIENINKACETVGLFGLGYVFRRLWLNVVAKVDENHDYEQECKLFDTSLMLIREYLSEIGNEAHCAVLVRHLGEPGWRRPLPQAMQSRLCSALTVTLVDNEKQRKGLERMIAEPDDVSLKIPEDMDGELVQTLLHELPHLTEGFTAAIQRIVGTDASQAPLLDAQRIAHTLKGACNTIGIRGIANLTHHLETIFEALSAQQQLPGQELGDALLDAADCLSAMADYLLGLGAAPEQALKILQLILDWDYRIKLNGVDCAVTSVDATMAEAAAEINSEVADNGNGSTTQAMSTIPADMLDQVIQVAAETGSLGERVHDKISGLLTGSDEVRDITWRLSELVAEMDRLVNIQSVTAKDNRSEQGFDSLEMEQYGEIHTCLSRLAEAAADVREQNAQMQRQLFAGKNLLLEQSALHKEQLEIVQNLRLVPVRKIIPRCQRIVRQTARMTGKEVELHISGENTLIDSELLNGLSDALMHLLRNAVDHGIEAPENRVAIGKSKRGSIRLSFANDRNALTVICQDDGGGLDTDRIWTIAHDKGWVDNRQDFSDDQIHHLIFRPGFSTKSQASQVSGRGIGMDVIQTQIAHMNGVMGLASRTGQGLTVTMNVPSNQYDVPMILARMEGCDYALSEHGVLHVFSSLEGRCVADGDNGLRYQVGQQSYAAATLSSLLGLERNNRVSDGASAILFKTQNGIEQIVLVDKVIGYRSLMIRPFGDYLKGVYGVLGCVMLQSGKVAPVIDLFELMSDNERRAHAEYNEKPLQFRNRVAKPQAMVVDDSLSARKAVVQLLQDAGFEVRTAIDGLDAIEKIEARKPDVILSDLEMPRMNGLELARYLKASTDARHIPIIMITSRSSAKHRMQADNAGVALYLTKPFNEDDLIVKLNALQQPLIETV